MVGGYGDKPRKRGRPRTAEEIRELVVKMAAENGWGYRVGRQRLIYPTISLPATSFATKRWAGC
jgi:hypothetical protein